MNVLICASRAFAPLSLVDDAIAELPDDATITAFGTTQVCRRAVLAATSKGIEARNVTLSRERRELLDRNATVWLFTACQPGSTELTEGIGQISAWLASAGIVARQIASPLPGRVCEAISRHHGLIDQSVDAMSPQRRSALTRNVLKANGALVELRDRYQEKLQAGLWLMGDDESATERWTGWLRCYESICDELDEAKTVLSEGRAA